jgi:DNA-binding MarR family transcriptional regulator
MESHSKYSLDEQLLDGIRTVIRLARIAQQTCEQTGLTLPQYRALNALAHQKRRAYDLASHSSISRPAVVALTAGLEKLNLLERAVAEYDGRGVYFTVSRKGQKALADANRLLVQRFAEILGDSKQSLKMLDTVAIDQALDKQYEREQAAFDPPKQRGRKLARATPPAGRAASATARRSRAKSDQPA